MPLTVREARPDDVPAVAALTRAHRHRLAAWGPRWWAVAQGADDLHLLWLEHLVRDPDVATVRVVIGGDAVVACAAAVPQADRWFVDDVAIDDDARWSDVAPALVATVSERPALTCAATADGPRRAALDAAGARGVSSYWLRPTATGEGPVAVAPFDGVARGRRPPHTFAGPFDPGAEGALAFSVSGGSVVGSPSGPAPPVYDPGGTVTVVDHVDGPDRGTLLDAALALAGARGDVLLAVVCGADDAGLTEALAERGFDRTVEVHRLP